MVEYKMISSSRNLCLLDLPNNSIHQTRKTDSRIQFSGRMMIMQKPLWFSVTSIQCSSNPSVRQSHSLSSAGAIDKSEKRPKKRGKKEHHLWKSRDSAASGHKAMNLVRIVSGLSNEKDAVYRALDEWSAWELEFPLIATAKGLKILRNTKQWLRVTQVAKWMLSKGQGTTMGTYDTVLLAFDQLGRVDEAGSLWNMILHTHTRSISKRLFSRMISLYDHHDMPDKIIEVFADMEELGVKPDEDTVRRVARVFERLGEVDKKNLLLQRYGLRWKYIHFNGERVKVRRDPCCE